jgi:hypothetical protein
LATLARFTRRFIMIITTIDHYIDVGGGVAAGWADTKASR